MKIAFQGSFVWKKMKIFAKLRLLAVHSYFLGKVDCQASE